MGAPSKIEVEAWSDRIAALVRKDLDGIDSELASAASNSLWDQVDASADPAVQNALGATSLAIDEQSLPENYGTAIQMVTSRGTLRAWVSALSSLVTSSGGGGYATLRAYLAAVSAQVHPLFAEVARALLGESAFTDSPTDVTTVFPPAYGSIAPSRVYTGADGALAEDTTDAEDAGAADVALFAADNDALYLGSLRKFDKVVIGLSTLASATIDPLVEYWNGNAWTAVSGLVDNSAGLTKNDTIEFTLPTDWTRSYKDKGGTALADRTPRYYLRIARQADALVTPPVATTVRLIPQIVPTSPGGSSHLGVQQPPLALVRITAVNTVSVRQIANLAHARFREAGASELFLRALTPIGGTGVTLTLSYTDQGGAASSQAQSAWSSIDPLDQHALSLAAGDTGLRDVGTGSTAVTDATEGVFEVIVAEKRTPAL